MSHFLAPDLKNTYQKGRRGQPPVNLISVNYRYVKSSMFQKTLRLINISFYFFYI